MQQTTGRLRLAQRIPVIVRLEKVPDAIKLRAGTTVSVVVVTGTSNGGGQVSPVPRVLRRKLIACRLPSP